MIIYKACLLEGTAPSLRADIVTDDEIISDTYNLKDIDDVVYEVDCRMITLGADNIDIGANPSAEEAEESLEAGQKNVIDIVNGFRLNYLGDEDGGKRAFATKKDFTAQLKGYFKKLVPKLKESGWDEDKVKAFQKKVTTYWTEKLAPNFKDLDFYSGESLDPDGMVVFLNYREDGVTPYVIIWKHGLKEMKV